MSSDIRHVTVDCTEPYELATFWSAVIGHPVDPEDQPGDDEVGLTVPAGAGPELLFVRVPDGKPGKNRVHLDLQPHVARDQEVQRLRKLGATLVDDRRRPDGTGWVVLADPEGNEFCVERSAAERHKKVDHRSTP
ncbi:VOC family protein [Actinoplanes sp. NEAU-A12]|uniref:VOC family protein n=1 Tax=Actinoplanes sandaracinus TaxID=3045177 RepID=A0ABT6X1T5_9ACTN|nr:VOC family protein [Actinoplanes sandaracinus]MDI6105992.1 VOC family protein [Actinoplanes sandaracinus]